MNGMICIRIGSPSPNTCTPPWMMARSTRGSLLEGAPVVESPRKLAYRPQKTGKLEEIRQQLAIGLMLCSW